MTFEDLGLSPALLDALHQAGYTEPTPIQQQAISYVLRGRDILGCAQTGTGKTASYTLPMIDVLAEGRAKARMPRSLILAPTRELAAQVAENFDKYGQNHKLTKALLIGGTSVSEQERTLNKGVDVLIATPGRLLDLFDRGRILLADVKILVIDESDRMLDMGFIPDIERIVSLLPPIRQTLMFSATMPTPIRKLADRFLLNPKEISVAPPASPAETVTQRLIRCPGQDKRKALNTLLETEEVTRGLIFCNRKRDVRALAKALEKREEPVGELHGDIDQPVRMETLERFRNGELKLLVCSDVAARGLDIPECSHVFNYDVPGHPEDYVHRIGRTGRAGRAGMTFMLATPADAKSLRQIEQMLGGAIPALDLDRVRILDAAEVEGSQETEPAPAKSQRSRRRRGRRRKQSGGTTEQPAAAEQARAGEEAADADTAANASATEAAPAAAEHAEAHPAATAETQPAADAGEPQPDQAATTQTSAEARESTPDEAHPSETSAEQQEQQDQDQPQKSKSRRSRGGKRRKGRKAPAQPAASGESSAPEQPAAAEHTAPEHTAAEPAAADTPAAQPAPEAAPEKPGSTLPDRQREAKVREQVPNGRKSKPFGDHTPAFLLKPTPQSATL